MGTTNGIEVSPDEKTLYVNESVQRKVWAFDIDNLGNISNKKLFHQFEDFGMDGMRCDQNGNLYITRHGKGTIVKLSPNGDIELLIKNLTRPNGISISNDERILYVANSDNNNPIIMKYELSKYGIKNSEVFFDGKELAKNDIGLFDGLKVHPTGTVFATGPGGVLIIKENGDHIGTIRTEVRTANCAFDDKFEYLYMTSDMFLTRIKIL